MAAHSTTHPPPEGEPAPNPTTHLCAHCNQPAALTCAGCNYAPSLPTAAATPTWYCSPACQSAHWPTHKATCKPLQALTSFHRAATLLQRLWYLFRAATFDALITDLTITRSHPTGAIQRIDAFVPPLADRHDLILPFPTHLLPASPPGDAARVRGTLLSMMECTHAHAHLAATIKRVLGPVIKTTPTSIEIAHVRPVVGAGALRYVFVDGPAEVPHERLVHVALKVRVHGARSGADVFAVDLTGAQYGWGWEGGEEERCWMDWGEFVAKRAVGGKVLEVTRFDEAVQDFLAHEKMLMATSEMMSKAEGESTVGVKGVVEFYERVVQAWDDTLRRWEKASGGGFQTLLWLPKHDYEAGVVKLLNFLKWELERVVAEVLDQLFGEGRRG